METVKKHTAEDLYKITIRVNRDLLEEIRQAAKQDRRSINNYLIETFLRQNAAQKPKK